jgi:GDP/UDP-N,N'-diacetylbacillosamine 2-epimerase (hydrolysing)
MRTICVVTGTRAEYGLLYWLMKEIDQDDELQLQVIVTGMHLSPEFGLTYRDVEKEFKIDKKIEMLLSSDTPIGISKSMGLAQISFAEAYSELQPDIVVLLGDRYEMFSAASAAMVVRIPIAHLHGGEATEGLIDEPIRHSITKMSHLHFTSSEVYRQRVIQLGEQPEFVYCFGAYGLDNIAKLELLSRVDFEKSIDFDLGLRNVLVTFHPVTLESGTAKNQILELLSALDKIENLKIIFTKANADTDGRIVNELIDEYVSQHPDKSVVFSSLGQLRYLSALQYMDSVVGNSSSGLIEVPSFKIPTVNIGDRQRGRVMADSVISCEPSKKSILSALELALSTDFRRKASCVLNPYGGSGAAIKTKNILKSVSLKGILKKRFYDLEVIK